MEDLPLIFSERIFFPSSNTVEDDPRRDLSLGRYGSRFLPDAMKSDASETFFSVLEVGLNECGLPRTPMRSMT